MRGHPRRVEEAVGLPLERARSRVSAYVYGNILVLSAVAVSTPAKVEDGHALVVVAATTLTTYVAHVLAHAVGEAITGTDAGEPEPVRDELRDALPIISSGTLPLLLMLLAAVTRFPPTLAVLLAAGVVILRLAGVGTLVSHLSGRPSTGRTRAWGLVVAVLSAVIVVLKVWLTH